MSLPQLGNGVGHPADELLDASLALFGAHHAVEIFGDHDVGGGLRPALRNLDVFLLEDHLAFFIGDSGGTQFPFHVIKGMNTLLGKVSLNL